MEINSTETVKTILDECRTIAVVGLSSNPARASNSVSQYMQRQGYKIIPVNPNETEVLGEPAFPTLEAAAAEAGTIDLVNVFRRSSEAGAVVDDAIRIGARAVWLQDGVIDRVAAQRALDAGLLVVMDDCILRQHARLKRGR